MNPPRWRWARGHTAGAIATPSALPFAVCNETDQRTITRTNYVTTPRIQTRRSSSLLPQNDVLTVLTQRWEGACTSVSCSPRIRAWKHTPMCKMGGVQHTSFHCRNCDQCSLLMNSYLYLSLTSLCIQAQFRRRLLAPSQVQKDRQINCNKGGPWSSVHHLYLFQVVTLQLITCRNAWLRSTTSSALAIFMEVARGTP